MKNRIKSFLWIMLFVLICIGLFKAKGDWFNVMMIITFISGLFIAFRIICYYIDFEEIYTKEIVNSFIKLTNSNLTYEKNPSLEIRKLIEKEYINADFDEYLDAGYWGQKFLEKYSVKDYIISDINNINVKFLHLKDISFGTGSNGRHVRFIREVYPEQRPFDGTFIIVPKSFNCDIRIHSVNKIYRENALINLNNEEFEKYFKVSSKKEEEVRKYLTTDLIKFILEFRKKYNIDFEIVFKDKVYVRFYTEDIFAQLNDKSIYKFFVINKFIKEFVEILETIK